ncbi:hypothetical protein BLM37_04540 [Candidatus Gracilibacteria bacterium GN02-873]|nr:hypothetical protein BLM37_04540 [Candidatus Gracilibacteria bacterium GN02-873]
MQIYNNNSGRLEEMQEKGFLLEKDMQKLTENNLDSIFGLEFIATEFQLHNLRIDTLAFDNETNSFVIIEYKRGSSYSVIDQAMAYLSLMLNNKAEFVQELCRKRKKFIDTQNIDWSARRIIIIADSFNRHQKDCINFKNLPVELWELKNFGNNIITFNHLKPTSQLESIHIDNEQKKSSDIKPILTYNEEYHLSGKPHIISGLYKDIENFILDLDSNFDIEYKKFYIAFRINRKTFFDIEPYQNFLRLYINLKKGEFSESGFFEDVSNKGHYGNGDYAVKIHNMEQLMKIKLYLEEAYTIKKQILSQS